MPIDAVGKGLVIGSSISITVTIAQVIPEGAGIKNGYGLLARATIPGGNSIFTTVPKTAISSHAVGATPTLTGTVTGFTNAGTFCTVAEPDGNTISVPCALVTAT